MQNNVYINVKRGLNSASKSWTQFNFNITFEINGKITDGNILWNYLYFRVKYTDNWKLRYVTDYNNNFELTITQQYSFLQHLVNNLKFIFPSNC